MQSPIIRGWKGLAEYTGFHWKTLQRWHYERCRLPFTRSKSDTKFYRWTITPDKVMQWMIMCGVDLNSQ